MNKFDYALRICEHINILIDKVEQAKNMNNYFYAVLGLINFANDTKLLNDKSVNEYYHKLARAVLYEKK